MIYIIASSDIHSPKYLAEFTNSLKSYASTCRPSSALFVLAGDIVFKGRVDAARPVFNAIREYCGDIDIVAVYGNEEFMGLEERFRKAYPDVKWLDDEIAVLAKEGKKLAVYGTRGVLDRPTRWQRRNMPGIWKIYRERLEKIKAGLEKARREADYVVLVTHYVPTYKMLKGEPVFAWPEMGSSRLEKVLIEAKPDLVIHGHAHNAVVLETRIDSVRVVNVAFPLRKKPVLLTLG